MTELDIEFENTPQELDVEFNNTTVVGTKITKTSELVNDGNGISPFATEEFVKQNTDSSSEETWELLANITADGTVAQYDIDFDFAVDKIKLQVSSNQGTANKELQVALKDNAGIFKLLGRTGNAITGNVAGIKTYIDLELSPIMRGFYLQGTRGVITPLSASGINFSASNFNENKTMGIMLRFGEALPENSYIKIYGVKA